MLSEPRPIFFETELKFLAFDETNVFGKSHVKKLYHELSGSSEPLYENLDMQASLPTLSTNHASGGSCSCSVGPDSLLIKDDNSDSTVDSFGLQIEHVLRAIEEIAPNSPPIIGQKTRVRALAQPHGHEDAVDLLAGEVAKVLEKIHPFGRPPAWFGIRFRFPPMEWEVEKQDGTKETKEEDTFISCRFETYAQDISQVWMEVMSGKLFREAVEVSGFESLIQNVRTTYEFLGRGRDFLNQFDDGNSGDSSDESSEHEEED